MDKFYSARDVRDLLKDIEPDRTIYIQNCSNLGRVVEVIYRINYERRKKGKPTFALKITDVHLTERTLGVYCRPN